jgi:hypothetical protein
MSMIKNYPLRLIWFVLTGVVAISLLIPGATLHSPWLVDYVNSDWIHFISYAVSGALAILAWKPRTALAACIAVALASIGLQLLRGILNQKGLDLDGAVINLLGVVAGILLGFHIRHSSWLSYPWHSSRSLRPPSGADKSEPTLSNLTARAVDTSEQPHAPYSSAGYSDRFSLQSADAKLRD